MRFLKKLVSKKGQLSMEMGILIAAAVLVAVIVAYYYTSRTKAVMDEAGKNANKTAHDLGNYSDNITKKTVDVAESVE